MDALGGLSRAVAILKQELKIPDSDNVALIELSREQMSPLMLLSGGASLGAMSNLIQVSSVRPCLSSLVGCMRLHITCSGSTPQVESLVLWAHEVEGSRIGHDTYCSRVRMCWRPYTGHCFDRASKH